MKNTKYIIASLLMAGLMAGCISQDYTDNKADAESVQSHIEQLMPVPQLHNVSSITRPPVVVMPLEKRNEILWLTQKTKVHVSHMPLSQVLSEVMRGVSADIWFDNDVNSSLLVTLSANTTRQNVLNLLSSRTGYGFVPSDNKVEVRRYLSETFMLTIPIGKVSAQQGTQGGSADDKSTKVEGQFISSTLDNADMVAEVTNAIKAVLKSNEDGGELIGGVEAIPSLSSFIVRTTPDRMRQVRQIVAQYKKELKKQVVLNIQILEFRSNLGKDRGIDWNILKDIGDGALQFVIPGTTTTAAASNGFGMAFQGTGKWDGTTAFIKALEQQGTVSTETPINIQTLSNQPARISQTLITPCLKDIKVNVTENSSSTETSRGGISEGVDVFVSANIQHDHVWLRMAGTLTKIASDTREKVDNNELRFITTRNVDLSFTNNLRYGQSVVIGSIKQQTTGANKSASFGVDALGAQSTSNEKIETLILLTPRRVR